MLSDMWANIHFWSECGNFADNITPDKLAEIAAVEQISEQEVREKIDKELAMANRVIVEAGMDLSDDDWADVAKAAKNLFGERTVLDLNIRRNLLGGARVSVFGKWIDNTVVTKYRKWRGYEK